MSTSGAAEAAMSVPDDPRFAFLGPTGSRVWLLPLTTTLGSGAFTGDGTTVGTGAETTLTVGGKAEKCQAGDTVTLHAVQTPQTELDH
ncbi:hypothetical protein [Micromonospora sp. LOL_024]|uniref:hypothetical protein n=1 Tax=Micromonospora sp. LOL_024 TaxID=3345412 RepID=UPI003A8965DD